MPPVVKLVVVMLAVKLVKRDRRTPGRGFLTDAQLLLEFSKTSCKASEARVQASTTDAQVLLEFSKASSKSSSKSSSKASKARVPTDAQLAAPNSTK